MSLINLYIKRCINLPVYKGPYVVKDYIKPRKNDYDLEEAAKEFQKIKASKVTEPSPFHVVCRIKKTTGVPWNEKVILRRLGNFFYYGNKLIHLNNAIKLSLGLHQRTPGEPVVLPNTPHFNKLLLEIKHLIRVKPVIFTNGIPTEKDIGATRLCPFTGRFEINEAFRVDDRRLNGDKKSLFYQGNYLRDYLRKLSGLFTISHH